MAKANAIDKTLSILPYVRQLFSDSEVQAINKKYDIFNDASVTKEKSVQRLSIVNQYDKQMEFSAQGGRIPNMYYNQLMYAQSSDDKKRRLIDYRVMAQYPEVESAIREICDEMFVKDDQGEILKGRLRGEYNDETVSLIEKEFQKFTSIYRFDEKGWTYARDFITEGELYFENIVSSKKPNLGIIGITRVSNERIDPLYYDLDNELIDCFLLRSKMPDQYPFQWGKFSHQSSYGRNNQQQILFLNDKQITYFPNDQWESEGKKYRIPHLANAHRPYRQLSLIEDATVIYMLVRAPERLVFNIDTGTMQAAKSEQYIKKLMTQFWQKKTIGNDGRIENTYDPVSMIENFYFAKPRDGSGSTVESVGGGSASPDNLEILNFFVQKLYKSLHVPLARLNSETAFSDGESITREELRFAKFIISIQKIMAGAVKKSFIVHLKLRGRKLIENAKKLGIEEIPDKDKNKQPQQSGESSPVNSLKLADVFKDNFNFKCWDYYDVIVEEIDKKINQLETEYLKKKENLIDRLYTINEELGKLTSDVLIEDSHPEEQFLITEAEAIGGQIEDYDDKLSEIKEIKENNNSWWDQYELKEEDIDVKFNEPSQFFALREQQIFQLKYDNFNNMSQNDLISNTFAQKIYLGYRDPQILANQEFLRRDAALRWELAQIEQSGPDFREKAAEEMKSAMEEGGQFENLTGGAGAGFSGGGGGGGSLPAGDTDLPSFGEPPKGDGEAGGSSGGGESLPAAGGGKPPSAPNAGGEPPKAPTAESYSREFLEKMDVLLETT